MIFKLNSTPLFLKKMFNTLTRKLHSYEKTFSFCIIQPRCFVQNIMNNMVVVCNHISTYLSAK